MKILELECSQCEERINLNLSEEEYQYFLKTGSLIEDSESYHELFDGYSWVLQQALFCDICKYNHSECYQNND